MIKWIENKIYVSINLLLIFEAPKRILILEMFDLHSKLSKQLSLEGEDMEPFLDDSKYYQNSKGIHKSNLKSYGETESHQYEPDESEIWKQHQALRCFYSVSNDIIYANFNEFF